MMTVHPGGPVIEQQNVPQSPRPLRKALRLLSLLTMVMTVPQVLSVWKSRSVSGVSLVSWLTYLISACLWLAYGIRRRDKTIYLACIGWILLDGAVVIGLLTRR